MKLLLHISFLLAWFFSLSIASASPKVAVAIGNDITMHDLGALNAIKTQHGEASWQYQLANTSTELLDYYALAHGGYSILKGVYNKAVAFQTARSQATANIDDAFSGAQKTKINKAEELAGEILGGNGVESYPSLIRQLVSKPSYKPLRIIWSKQNKTTTFIGKWDEIISGQQNGLQKVYEELSQSDLNIYMQSGKFDNPSGFNMLSIDNFPAKQAEYAQKLSFGHINSSWSFDDYIWEAYNKPWLESALQRGDDIVLATKYSSKDNVINPITNKLIGNFAYELEYLSSLNYKPINVTMEEWTIIKSWFGY